MTIEVEGPAWDGLLEELGCADAYLRKGYVEAACRLDGGRPVFLHLRRRGADVVFAVSVRPVPSGDGLFDVATPYGYGGPVAPGERAYVEEFWDEYEGWCAEHRVVSSFVAFHPLFANHEYAPGGLALEPLADTIAWPLAEERDPFESLHRHHRRVVRKAEGRVELVVRENPQELEEFAALYATTMERRDAERFYFFPAAYWETLATELLDALVLFEAHDEAGLAAATLCLASPPWLHYHLGATSERARRQGAATLLMLSAARWGRQHGFSAFHLGGGVGGREDSLWAYKRRFAPDGARPMHIGKAVHDLDAYRGLTGSDGPERGAFFPAYRANPSASVPGRGG